MSPCGSDILSPVIWVSESEIPSYALLSKVRVSSYVFSDPSRSIWMTFREMSPVPHTSSPPILLFQHLIHLNIWSFLYPESLGVQTHDMG